MRLLGQGAVLHTAKPLSNGTSLGLCVVHGFMRQSGGQVRVYSDVGRGTTMCSAGHGIPQPLLFRHLQREAA